MASLWPSQDSQYADGTVSGQEAGKDAWTIGL
jgi:hypothetical protein